MFVEFYTSNGIRVQVLEVSVLLHKSAFIQSYLFLPTGLTLFKIDMNEDEYKLWGNDDDYIKHFICSKMEILGNPIDGQAQPIQTSTALISSDSRSVHNESDIQKIQTLQEQLTQMESKLKTITELLFKNGSL